jgi:hypothetical protein
VQCAVEFAVAASVESVADRLAGGGGYRCRTAGLGPDLSYRRSWSGTSFSSLIGTQAAHQAFLPPRNDSTKALAGGRAGASRLGQPSGCTGTPKAPPARSAREPCCSGKHTQPHRRRTLARFSPEDLAPAQGSRLSELFIGEKPLSCLRPGYGFDMARGRGGCSETSAATARGAANRGTKVSRFEPVGMNVDKLAPEDLLLILLATLNGEQNVPVIASDLRAGILEGLLRKVPFRPLAATYEVDIVEQLRLLTRRGLAERRTNGWLATESGRATAEVLRASRMSAFRGLDAAVQVTLNRAS